MYKKYLLIKKKLMKKYLITLLLLTWFILQTQLFSYSWNIIWDTKCSEINEITRYSNLSPTIITKIDLIWDRINEKYKLKDNVYKEKVYNLFEKVLNEHLQKTTYSGVQKEVLLRIWDYFVCKKENLNITQESLEIHNLQISNITDHWVKVTWEWNPNAQTWLYVKKTGSTGQKNDASNNIFEYKILASDYEFTLFVQAVGSDVIKEVNFRTLSVDVVLWNTTEDDEVINQSNNEAKLLFKSSFDPGTNLIMPRSHKLVGKDNVSGYTWPDDLPGNPSKNFFNYVIGNYNNYLDFADTKIDNVSNVPNSTATKALYIEFKKDDPNFVSYSRNQYVMWWNSSSNDMVQRLNQGYIKYKMKSHIDKESDVNWSLPLEWKDENDDGFRFGLYIIDASKDIPYWRAQGQYMVNGGLGSVVWSKDNFTIPVPEDEWFEFECFWYAVPNSSQGRLKFAVNGQVIFDITDQMKDPAQPTKMFYFSPFKVYGAAWYQWITDFEYWDTPPATSVLSK